MLPARYRMRHGDEFGAAISSGARSSTRLLVVHYHYASTRAEPARVGFVVSKAVGGAVQRNLVKRRLRAAMAEDLDQVPAGAAVVVRALPAAAGASFAGLRADLRRTWRKARDKDQRRGGFGRPASSSRADGGPSSSSVSSSGSRSVGTVTEAVR